MELTRAQHNSLPLHANWATRDFPQDRAAEHAAEQDEHKLR